VKAALLGAAAAGVTAAAAAAVLSDRAPYPYSLHRLLDIPLPLLTARRLDSLLEPRAGQQVLEIGPGTGLQSLHVAPQLGAGGQLAVVDVQPEMLEHVMARAARPASRAAGDAGTAGQRRACISPAAPAFPWPTTPSSAPVVRTAPPRRASGRVAPPSRG
jgi:SAM-dependent methyltransferase